MGSDGRTFPVYCVIYSEALMLTNVCRVRREVPAAFERFTSYKYITLGSFDSPN